MYASMFNSYEIKKNPILTKHCIRDYNNMLFSFLYFFTTLFHFYKYKTNIFFKSYELYFILKILFSFTAKSFTANNLSHDSIHLAY